MIVPNFWELTTFQKVGDKKSNKNWDKQSPKLGTRIPQRGQQISKLGDDHCPNLRTRLTKLRPNLGTRNTKLRDNNYPNLDKITLKKTWQSAMLRYMQWQFLETDDRPWELYREYPIFRQTQMSRTSPLRTCDKVFINS